GTTLGQALVVGISTNRVSVTFNGGGGLRVLVHEVSQVLNIRIAFLLDHRLVEVEFHVQFDANNFSSRLRLSYRLRSGLRSRLYSSNLLNLASVATEVQTDTDTSHP